jgi:serpin B
MRLEGNSFEVSYDTELPGAVLPFKGEYSFMGVIPADAKRMKTLLSKIDGKWIKQYRQAMHVKEVTIEIPKLDLSTYLQLNPAIEALGAGSIFQPPLDLSTLAPTQARDKDQFFIGTVIQQAKMTLDEEGVKAAAVTEITGSAIAMKPPDEVHFDRPFLYFIIHEPTGTIVLCGVVNDPTKQ